MLKVLYDLAHTTRSEPLDPRQRAAERFAALVLEQAMAHAGLEVGLTVSPEAALIPAERHGAAAGPEETTHEAVVPHAVASQALPRRVHSLYATAYALRGLKRRTPGAWRVARGIARRAYGVPPPLPPVPPGPARVPADIHHDLLGLLPSATPVHAGARVATLYEFAPARIAGASDSVGAELFHSAGSKRRGSENWLFSFSVQAKNDLEAELPPDASRVLVAAPAVPATTFYRECDAARLSATRAALKLPRGRYLLGLSGGDQSLEHVVHCFCRLMADVRLPETFLVLRGTAPAATVAMIRRAERDAGCGEVVFVTGELPDTGLASLYSSAEGFVLPSLYEASGLLPLEALRCGTPVITANAGASAEVVADAAIVVDPRDADALCRAMLLLLVNEDARAHLADLGIARARLFSAERTFAETLTGYHEMLRAAAHPDCSDA